MKGILFKPGMIKAIVEGRKTVTRRVMQNQPTLMDKVYYKVFKKDFGGRKPRYHVGEVVYIKEAWAVIKTNDGVDILDMSQNSGIFYKFGENRQGDDNELDMEQGRWRTPLFMPAWAARDFIQITDVRAERLQEITFEDCLAEGIVHTEAWQKVNYKAPEPLHPDNISNEEIDKEIDRGWEAYTKQAYATLWDSINGKGDFSLNKWVWRYEFKRVESPIGRA